MAEPDAAEQTGPRIKPPAEVLIDLLAGKWVSQAISVAARLGVADMLREGPKPCDELARANQVDSTALYRLLRALASVGLFRELDDAPRTFALTPLAEVLRSDVPGSMRGLAMLSSDEFTWRPWGDLLRSVKTGEPATERAFGMDAFSYLAQNLSSAAILDEAMSGWSELEESATAAAYDFSRFRTLVDVGGGYGRLLTTILERNPGLRGVLFDQPHVVEGAQSRIEAAGLTSRCEVVGGSFFDSVPPGGDAYILKHMMHDWKHLKGLTILRHCRAAIAPGGRLLLVEIVIPEGNGPSLGKLYDLEMLVIEGDRVRTEAEYADLLGQAGFRLTRIISTRSPSSVIEAEPI